MEGETEITLIAWLHPSMQLPFEFKEQKFTVKKSDAIVTLMEACEDRFEEFSKAKGCTVELVINVIWNIKDHKKALNPNDEVGQHYAPGDSFGVYGDIQENPLLQGRERIPEDQKTPVTILTGFLGAGKTTMLNYILQEQREKKIAIIENEFGEVSIDDALLKNPTQRLAEKVVVMDNGCMCCTLRGDLVNGLQSILDEMHKGSAIDAIMIETTGMADPVPIVRTFMSSPELTGELRLDGVITVADGKNLIGRLDDNIEAEKINEAFQQIAFADKIILNKLDLVTTDEAIAVKDRIRNINAYAKILPAVKGRVKLDELSNMRAHDMCNFINEDIAKEAEVAPELAHGGHGGHDGHEGHGGGHDEANCDEDHGHGGGHAEGHGGDHGGGHGAGHGTAHGAGHGHGHGGASRHDSRVNSFGIIKEGEIIAQRLSMWMQEIGQLHPDKGQIFRIKAILAVKGHPYKHVFHAVMDTSDEDDAEPWAPGEKKINKIVFIGKGMDQEYLRSGFEAIFA